MENEDLKQRVDAALRSRPGLTGKKIGTEVFGDRVYLIGDVDTLAQEREALLAIKSVPGVKEVLSALRIAELDLSRAAIPDDTALTQQVRDALLDHGISLENGGVSVSDGKVYLQGKVDSAREMIKAERLASIIKGVRAVENQLHV